MIHCDLCVEPAARSYTMGTGTQAKSKYLCYFHAAEADLLNVPLEPLKSIARETKYPLNGITFILEAMHRADKTVTAKDICAAVIKSAREQFRGSASSVFAAWTIYDKSDIGRIVTALAQRELIQLSEGVVLADFEKPFTLKDILDVSK